MRVAPLIVIVKRRGKSGLGKGSLKYYSGACL